jgi:Lar family restriction alleviation protein
MSQAQLKSCPFCGAAAELRKTYFAEGTDVAYVACTHCGCRTGNYELNGPWSPTYTVNDPIDAWNKRVNEPGTDDLEKRVTALENDMKLVVTSITQQVGINDSIIKLLKL